MTIYRDFRASKPASNPVRLSQSDSAKPEVVAMGESPLPSNAAKISKLVPEEIVLVPVHSELRA
jgi:hypothetical protein